MKQNKFNIIVPFYNVEKWVSYCVNSVANQSYSNYECYLIDDMSTDNTVNIIESLVADDNKFHVIRNQEKKYALKNIHDTLDQTDPNDNDIIVILDGDDWLAGDNVLEKLNNVYNLEKCWMTYGSYIEYPHRVRGKFASKISDHIIENKLYRESEWMASHLRTFRYKLWDKINTDDFIFSKSGKHVKAAWDLAFVYPMLEMAGNRAHYVKDILYVYNRANPLNEDKINHNIQLSEENEIRQKSKYALLEVL
tara:strand:+ start:3309 stop:4061 length:753 start_codon:yes stop_codon:yes gene_type:complete